ncbi:MAG: hypothetical protein EOO06_10475 [Chitinophagaceae bacterium]|nr:MAG: hypothetical protein EOO06_10475 [Chitinophagaceae bacterium]
MDKRKLTQLVDDTLNSMDDAGRAAPAPFLLTRIMAKKDNMAVNAASMWERVSAVIGRPVIAFPVIALVLLVNFFIIRSAMSSGKPYPAEYSKVSSDDYSLSNATSLFDYENGQR